MKNSLEQILNNNQYLKTSDILTVDENDPNAKVKSVSFVAQGYDFFKIERKLIEGNPLDCFKSTCDGLFFIEYNNQYYLFLVELKSSFVISEIHKAKKQIEASLLKLQFLFNIFEKYNLKNWNIKTFIVSNASTEEQRNHILKNYNVNAISQPDYNLCVRLIRNNCFYIKKNNSIAKNLPLKFQNFQLHYIPYETIEKWN